MPTGQPTYLGAPTDGRTRLSARSQHTCHEGLIIVMRPDESHAIARFLDDDFAGAWSILIPLARSGPLSIEARTTVELLLDHPMSGWDATDELALITTILAHNDDDIAPLERTRWFSRRFDATVLTGGDVQEAALDLIAIATMAGDSGWDIVTDSSRYARIQSVFLSPDAQLDLLEQESYAPKRTGIPQTVPGRVFAIGQDMVHAGELASARQAERLLHDLGQGGFAYALEGARKQAAGRLARETVGSSAAASSLETGSSTSIGGDLPIVPGTIVVLAGGHPPLRRMAQHDLSRYGIRVREVPSAWEANRTIRAIRDMLSGADAGILIWRQIAHSTTYQVMTAAQQLGVPVVRAATPTVSAIQRAVTSVLQRDLAP